jgi:hypothetical protein
MTTNIKPVAWVNESYFKSPMQQGYVVAPMQVARCQSPLYDQATLDAAVAAERERWAPAWVPVAERLPDSGVTVLACYRNALGNVRRIRAQWVAARSQEAGLNDDNNEFDEYDEETDTYFVPEGWHECMDNWDDYTSVAVHQGVVSHWMPLPAPPGDAP